MNSYSGYYLNLKRNSENLEIIVSPFSEKEIKLLLRENFQISVIDIYIQSFGENILEDKYFTEKDFNSKMLLFDLLSFIDQISDYSINSLKFSIDKLGVMIHLTDEIITKLNINNDKLLKNYLLDIFKILDIKQYYHLIDVVCENTGKYVCFNNSKYEIFSDFWEMQSKSTIIS